MGKDRKWGGWEREQQGTQFKLVSGLIKVYLNTMTLKSVNPNLRWENRFYMLNNSRLTEDLFY